MDEDSHASQYLAFVLGTCTNTHARTKCPLKLSHQYLNIDTRAHT